ncbi:MAG: ATP phosphoribosyltransferase [Candidatus Micrarchaeota archaeon]
MIRFAIPNKGRMCEPAIKMLGEAGMKLLNGEGGERKLFARTSNPEVQAIFVRAQDIPEYVEAGAADVGITGYDLVAETGARVEVVERLSFGGCRVALAVPENSRARDARALRGKRIATCLPRITRAYFRRKKIPVKIVRISGAAEIAPYLGIADAIVDNVSTGTTLALNKLRVLEILLESSACLIANRKIAREKRESVEEMALSFRGMISAESKKYVMANVTSEEALGRVVRLMPCMESPTVLQLAKKGEYAVHAVVEEGELARAIRRMKEAGAKDILVLAMERVVP